MSQEKLVSGCVYSLYAIHHAQIIKTPKTCNFLLFVTQCPKSVTDVGAIRCLVLYAFCADDIYPYIMQYPHMPIPTKAKTDISNPNCRKGKRIRDGFLPVHMMSKGHLHHEDFKLKCNRCLDDCQ